MVQQHVKRKGSQDIYRDDIIQSFFCTTTTKAGIEKKRDVKEIQAAFKTD